MDKQEETIEGVIFEKGMTAEKYRQQIIFEHYLKIINVCNNHLQSGLCKTCKLWFDGDTPTCGIGNCYLRVLEYLPISQLKAFIEKVETLP